MLVPAEVKQIPCSMESCDQNFKSEVVVVQTNVIKERSGN